MNESDGAPLWALTATELAARFANGAATPIEALYAVLGRVGAVNPRINAIILLDEPGAHEAAAASAERWRRGCPLSRFDGVPITVKDNIHVAGLRASWGSALHAGLIATADEPPVRRLREAGLVILGKTNVPEFTMQGYTANPTFGVTGNPWAPTRTPGGSSGGACAAVAGGMAPLAIGTDGGGSLRRPAAHCGLYALKPSVGAIARAGGFPPVMLDFEVIGPIARSPEDLAALFDLLSHPDPADPRSLLAALPNRPLDRPPSIAYLPRIVGAPVDRQVAAAVERLASSLADEGCRVQTIAVPPLDLEEVGTAWNRITCVGIAAHLRRSGARPDQAGPAAWQAAAAGAASSALDMLEALESVRRAREAMGGFFARYDLLLMPSAAALAWPAAEAYPAVIDGQAVGPRGHAVFTAWLNVAGVPAVTVPVAMTADAGGIGAQIAAGFGRDRALLDFIRASPAIQALGTARLAPEVPTAP